MKTLQVNTTQNVKINFEVANVGQRLLAFVLDNIIKLAYIYFLTKFVDMRFIGDIVEQDYWSRKALGILFFLPITFYSLYSEILLDGQTIGKKVLKIKVINIEGFKPSILDYTIRWFSRIVDFNFFILVFVLFNSQMHGKDFYIWLWFIFLLGKLIGFFMIVFTDRNQRMGDISANTVVVSLKDTASFSRTILENIKDNYKPTYPNVIKLSDNDVRIVKDTYTKAKKAKDYNTLIKLRVKIEEVTGVSKDKEIADVNFIDTVLKDFNYYTQDK